MTKPHYQPILEDMIPSVNLPLGIDGTDTCLATAGIIVEELNGIVGQAKTFSLVQMWDVSLPHVGSEIDSSPIIIGLLVFVGDVSKF